MLVLSVGVAGTTPIFVSSQLADFIAPSAAAFSAAIGARSEYIGKKSVADGKEIAAQAMFCAAEAEVFLSRAERAKAVTPLCVGIGALSAALNLLVPAYLRQFETDLQASNEISALFWPLAAISSAAVASLALQDTTSFAGQAVSVGVRRFATPEKAKKTWLSSTELIQKSSEGASNKLRNFAFSILPAPVIGSLCPGDLAAKTIIVSALAAAQSAYSLVVCEYVLSRATDSVALKSRCAAVCDTYANQAARSSAILPYTSSLSGLCAASAAAVVEFPIIETLGASGRSGLIAQTALLSMFPLFSTLFAAASTVSKGRCRIDEAAVSKASQQISLDFDNNQVLRPVKGVWELIRLTTQSSIVEPLQRYMQKLRNIFSKWRGSDRAKPQSPPEGTLV